MFYHTLYIFCPFPMLPVIVRRRNALCISGSGLDVSSHSFCLLSKFRGAITVFLPPVKVPSRRHNSLHLLSKFRCGITILVFSVRVRKWHNTTSSPDCWPLRILCKTNFMEQCTHQLRLLNVQKLLFEYVDYTTPTAMKHQNSDSC
jgi:hypothetical protein